MRFVKTFTPQDFQAKNFTPKSHLCSNLFVSLSLGPAYFLLISRPAIRLLQIKNAFQGSYPCNFAVFFYQFKMFSLNLIY